jgi:hypothetical protein
MSKAFLLTIFENLSANLLHYKLYYSFARL